LKIIRIIAAIVLTLGLLYVARITSEGRPEYREYRENGFAFEKTTVPKAPENALATIPVTIKGPLSENVRPVLRYYRAEYGEAPPTAPNRYQTRPLSLVDSLTGLYEGQLRTAARGYRHYYWFEIRDHTGGLRAKFTDKDGTPFVLKHIGHVPDWVLIPHIVFMFATVFCIMLATVYAMRLVFGSQEVRPMARLLLWAAIFVFLGGGPFGWAMNYYAFGTIWEGVPFGTDATDNKTQLLFVYLVFMLLATRGSLKHNLVQENLYSPRALGFLGLMTLVLMLSIYLIPHSTQFSPELTRTVCYTFIAVVGLMLLIPWVSRKAKRVRRP